MPGAGLGGAECALPLLTLANPGQRNRPPPHGEETEAQANYTGPPDLTPASFTFPHQIPLGPHGPGTLGPVTTVMMD